MKSPSLEQPPEPEASASRKLILPPKPGMLERLYPTVALVGRPNVGKSSLFNALLGREVSITDARAGTTRDRVLHPIKLMEKACDLLDTGGIGIVDEQNLTEHIEQQIQAAVASATILALVVDAKEGLTPLDRQVATRLRALGRPMLMVANKAEGKEAALTVGEFSALGIEPVIATSALHRRGLEELEEALAAMLPVSDPDAPLTDWEGLPKIAVVGRRNVGKSSFVNALARQDRTIVSEIAGTTRDSIDLLLHKDNRPFVLIDTAGLRRMKEPEGPVEFFSQVRTERAIRRADVVMLMVSAPDGFGVTDRKTLDMIVELYKSLMIVVNKWDLATDDATTGAYVKYIESILPSLKHTPLAFTSAQMGRRCWQTLDVALDLYDQAHADIPTPKLNKAIEEAERWHEPPAKKNKKPRLLYGVQVAKGPSTFVIYGRHTSVIDDKYKRYLARSLGEKLGIEEVPLRIFFRDAPR
ncbi:MAG: GTPase Der [Planctomycetota bacterium]